MKKKFKRLRRKIADLTVHILRIEQDIQAVKRRNKPTSEVWERIQSLEADLRTVIAASQRNHSLSAYQLREVADYLDKIGQKTTAH